MKITKSKLKEMIREEILREGDLSTFSKKIGSDMFNQLIGIYTTASLQAISDGNINDEDDFNDMMDFVGNDPKMPELPKKFRQLVWRKIRGRVK